ncbi:MAG: hypothetical protein ACTJHU_00335 [Mycetocola sp.]
MDISATTAPKSDQQNYEDYLGGPKTVTVADVRPGTSEQPVEVHLVEFPGRPFKPSKTARRMLIAAWGKEADDYLGRRMTLYGDPTVKFGGQAVGGIRISHVSHIDKPVSIALTVTRGKRAMHTIQPLPDNTVAHIAAFAAAASLPELQEAWQAASADGVTGNPSVIAAKDRRKNELQGASDG